MSRQTEYTSVFSPFDAEAVQGKDRMNPLTTEGLFRINAFINNELSKGVYSPHNAISNLKVKLNHLNLDFPFNNTTEIQPSNNFEVSHGNVFGATPTTNLMNGFDTGADLPKYNLTINVVRSVNGNKLEGKLEPSDSKIFEAVEYKIKSKKRVSKLKKMLKEKKKKEK
jgi:hypothetical protein